LLDPAKLLALFLSMTVLSIFLDETGFFKWLANAVLKRSGKGQVKLFTLFFLTVSLVTIFTSNDIVILTFTPFLCYFAKNAKVDPIPYLVSCFVAANTASMLLIIGNPTNIYLATSAGIDFVEYLRVMALPTVLATLTAYFVMLALFYRRLKQPINATVQDVKIANKLLLVIGLAILATATALLVISSYIKIEMYLVAVGAVGLLCTVTLFVAAITRKKPVELLRTIRRVPWMIAIFMIYMFAIVMYLDSHGVTTWLTDLFGSKHAIIVYGLASVLFANLINNIPMSILFTSVLAGATSLDGVYASIIGSNIGAFLTPIGALAGIMWLSILKTNEIKFSFASFTKYGFIIAIPVLAAALFGLWLSMML